MSARVEYVLEYRDHPQPEWHFYSAFGSPLAAQERIDGLVKRGLREQGVDFRIVQVITTCTRIVVHERPFASQP